MTGLMARPFSGDAEFWIYKATCWVHFLARCKFRQLGKCLVWGLMWHNKKHLAYFMFVFQEILFMRII